jgi:hypothetical protein
MWLEDEENYEDWRDNMIMLLGSKGLDQFINHLKDTSPTPSSVDDLAEDSAKLRMNRMTCGISIKGSIHPEAAVTIKGITDPAEMWRLLEEGYTSKGWNLKHKYLTEYNTLRVEHFDSIRAFINQFKMLKSKLDFVGIQLPEEVYTINFIALLDTQYPVWADRQRSNVLEYHVPST